MAVERLGGHKDIPEEDIQAEAVVVLVVGILVELGTPVAEAQGADSQVHAVAQEQILVEVVEMVEAGLVEVQPPRSSEPMDQWVLAEKLYIAREN